jgi:tripartite-type tricarboxylate transporter receptor subunit TctC
MQRGSPSHVRRIAVAIVLVGLVGVGQAQAGPPAGTYPSRPIDFLVTWGPGGGADTMARTLARLAEPLLGVPLPVSNLPGGAGHTGLAKLLSAPADGYTLASYTGATLATVPMEMAPTKLEDFAWVARTQIEDSFLFVKADSPYPTIEALLEYARVHPAKLQVAATGFGTVDYLSVRYLATRGYPMTLVPYAKPEERYAAVVKGYAQVLYEQAGDVRHLLEAKQLRPILIFADKRHPAFPAVPTSKELGLEIELPNFRAVVVKAGTPRARVNVLAEAFRKASETAEWRTFSEANYMRPDGFMGPEALRPWVRQQMKLLKTYVAELGERAE